MNLFYLSTVLKNNMIYTDQQIREKTYQLQKAGAPSSDIEKFIKLSKQEQSASIPEQKESLLSKAAGAIDVVMKPASDFLFGSTGKAVGSVITSGIAGAAELAGKKEFGKALQEQVGGFGAEKPSEVTPTNIAFTALELYPGGGFLTSALKKIPGGAMMATKIEEAVKILGKNQQEKAIKLYTEALAPTTKQTKRQAAKIVPELLKRGEKAGIVGGLETIKQKAAAGMEVAGQSIDELLKVIGDKAKEVKPILERLELAKTRFVVEGVVIEPKAVAAIDDVMKTILEFGKEASIKSLRKVRQIWDASIAEKGGFEKFQDELTSFAIKAKKEGSNAIRTLLAKESPELATLNKEFTFWRNVDDVITATLERTSGQSGRLKERIGSAIGAGIGSTTGGLTGALAGTEFGRRIVGALNSAAWKTRSALWRKKFADTLLKGDKEGLNLLLKELGVGIKNLTDDQSDDESTLQ